MIKAQELRVGNLVLHDRCICEIDIVNSDRFTNCSLKTKQGNYINARYDQLKPLNLAVVFLSQFDFKQNGILFEKGKFAIKSWTVGSEIEWVIFWGNKVILYKNEYPVHELQNLYYALSGEELIAEPTR